MAGLKHLGKQDNTPTEKLDTIPFEGAGMEVELECSEFTSHCPVTKQPDFATLSIRYVPGKHLVETKSLKLFLWRYRDKKAFNEAIVTEIADAFFAQVQPAHLVVEGRFFPRGGISVTARAQRHGGDK